MASQRDVAQCNGAGGGLQTALRYGQRCFAGGWVGRGGGGAGADGGSGGLWAYGGLRILMVRCSFLMVAVGGGRLIGG